MNFQKTETYPFLKTLENNFAKIREEYEAVARGITMRTWPEVQKFTGSWQVFGFYHNGRKLDSCCKRAPFTTGLLDSIAQELGTKVYMAGFSRMTAGTIILPHVDEVTTEKRIHLGLKIPQGDCAFVVNGEQTAWKEGQAFVFDARVEHNAWNKTPEDRVILLVDFERF